MILEIVIHPSIKILDHTQQEKVSEKRRRKSRLLMNLKVKDKMPFPQILLINQQEIGQKKLSQIK